MATPTNMQQFQSSVTSLDLKYASLKKGVMQERFLHSNQRYTYIDQIQQNEAKEIANQINDLKKMQSDLIGFKKELKVQSKTYKELVKQQIHLTYGTGQDIGEKTLGKLWAIEKGLISLKSTVVTEKKEASFRIKALEAFVERNSLKKWSENFDEGAWEHTIERENALPSPPTPQNTPEPDFAEKKNCSPDWLIQGMNQHELPLSYYKRIFDWFLNSVPSDKAISLVDAEGMTTLLHRNKQEIVFHGERGFNSQCTLKIKEAVGSMEGWTYTYSSFSARSAPLSDAVLVSLSDVLNEHKGKVKKSHPSTQSTRSTINKKRAERTHKKSTGK